MPVFAVVNQIDLHRLHVDQDFGLVELVKQRMRFELGREVIEKLPLDEPTMVRIQEHEVENYAMRSLEVGYRIETLPCRHMDTFVRWPMPPINVPPIYVDRPVRVEVEKIVERIVPPPPPPPDDRTPYQWLVDFLNYIAPEVQYDAGYGEPLPLPPEVKEKL